MDCHEGVVHRGESGLLAAKPGNCGLDFGITAYRQGDRLDLLAANYLGDPLMFWLLCDANGAVRPNALVETPGKVLNITTPQGVPGTSNA